MAKRPNARSDRPSPDERKPDEDGAFIEVNHPDECRWASQEEVDAAAKEYAELEASLMDASPEDMFNEVKELVSDGVVPFDPEAVEDALRKLGAWPDDPAEQQVILKTILGPRKA